MKALKFLKEQQRRHINMAETMKVAYFDDELDEAIAELEKLEKIKSYCEEQKDTWESQANGDHKVYEKILKELNK